MSDDNGDTGADLPVQGPRGGGDGAAVADRLEEIRSSMATLSGQVTTALDELRETMLDAASGEVVGSLWDEFRQLRATVETLVDQTGRTADPDAVESLRTEVAGLTTSVHELLERAEVADADDRAPADDVRAELAGLRSGVDDVIARLDEGLVIAEDPAEVAAPEPVDLTPVTARLDRLHDDLTEHFELGPPGVEPVDLSPVLTALAELRSSVDDLTARPAPEPVVPAGEPAEPAAPSGPVTIDPDVLDVLREEIRAAGSASDELVESLRTELIALRRRIRLRAEGELFTDEQLDRIAEAVAERMADGAG